MKEEYPDCYLRFYYSTKNFFTRRVTTIHGYDVFKFKFDNVQIENMLLDIDKLCVTAGFIVSEKEGYGLPINIPKDKEIDYAVAYAYIKPFSPELLVKYPVDIVNAAFYTTPRETLRRFNIFIDGYKLNAYAEPMTEFNPEISKITLVINPIGFSEFVKNRNKKGGI